MDPPSVTAVTPFRLLDLPREIRDDIYESSILDLSPPDMFINPHRHRNSLRLRKINTNVLLTNRQVYWEARDVIVRRAQLIMVSVWCWGSGYLGETFPRITAIHPMYRNLCIMSHRIDDSTSPGRVDETKENWRFILHRQDIEFLCRVIMGEFNNRIGQTFGPDATHTLDLRYSPTYGQHEFSSIYSTQTLVLQRYRNILCGIKEFSICGTSLGWENGLYGAILKDIRSIDDREPTNLIDGIRTLEQQGSQVLLQTGDVEAADVFWARALGMFRVVRASFSVSAGRYDFRDFPFSNGFKKHVERWTRLRRQNGDECVIPFIELLYKLTSLRLSGALRFIEQGHHLVTRHGRAPRAKQDHLDFMFDCFGYVYAFKFFFRHHIRSHQPFEEAQFKLDLTMATIYRLLDATDHAKTAYHIVCQVSEFAPDDESIQQEKERVCAWLSRLVDSGALNSFPEP